MHLDYDRKLILKNGEEYYGFSFGDSSDRIVEIVFNTSMAGYQEILSDPSYTDQGVVMTYPLIGNYGMADDDYETQTPTIGAMIVREYNDFPSNFRSTATLDAVMKRYQIPGIHGVDTRRLTRTIRSGGSQQALLTRADLPLEDGIMIGRATYGHPWIFQEIRHYLQTGELMPQMSVTDRVALAKRHLAKSLEIKGDRVGILEMRRHLSCYFKGLPDFKETRLKLVTINDPQELFATLDYIAERWGEEAPEIRSIYGL